MMKKYNIKKHSNHGISVWLPREFAVDKNEARNIYASEKGSGSTFLLTINPKDFEVLAEQAKLPLPPPPVVNAKIHKEGTFKTPFKGWERLAEHSDPKFLHWIRLLEINKKTNLHIEITDFGTFEDKAERWAQVLDSISIDNQAIGTVPLRTSIRLVTEYGFVAIGPKIPSKSLLNKVKYRSNKNFVSNGHEVIVFGPLNSDVCLFSFEQNCSVNAKGDTFSTPISVKNAGIFVHDVRGAVASLPLKKGDYVMRATIAKCSNNTWHLKVSFEINGV